MTEKKIRKITRLVLIGQKNCENLKFTVSELVVGSGEQDKKWGGSIIQKLQ